MSENPADTLKRRASLALGVVALLVLLNQLLVLPSLTRLTFDAPVLNIAGRQRMLSQRLSKAALALETSDETARTRHLAELGEVLALWSASHAGLLHGDRAASLPDTHSRAIRAALDGLEPFFVPMRDAAARLKSGGAPGQAGERAEHADVAVILGAEAEYLERMDTIVGLFEREARERVGRMFWTGWVVTGSTLLALVSIGVMFVRPAVELIRGQVEALERGRQELEDRVRARTRDLEAATLRHQALVEQLGHAARTTTIGEMASGLAHELNQPLGAITNYAEGCLAALAEPRPALDEVRSALERVRDTTMRAGRIIERIRKFVTRQAPRREWFDPNQVVADAEEILRDEAASRSTGIAIDLAPDLPRLWGDPVQVQQVLVNLMRNAFDAIAVAKPPVPTLVIQTRPSHSGGVEFLITDNGEGIEPERLEHVFDAYFSTRAGGMGMGLSISRTIIEAHDGQITVSSVPGVTTTFRFTLPVGMSDDAGSDSLHRG
jgi:two-component system sensor kinase FixL